MKPQSYANGMSCPECGVAASAVVNSRMDPNGMRICRRRECRNGHRYSTTEIVSCAPRPVLYVADWQI